MSPLVQSTARNDEWNKQVLSSAMWLLMCVSGIRACKTALFIREATFFAYIWDLTRRRPIITSDVVGYNEY